MRGRPARPQGAKVRGLWSWLQSVTLFRQLFGLARFVLEMERFTQAGKVNLFAGVAYIILLAALSVPAALFFLACVVAREIPTFANAARQPVMWFLIFMFGCVFFVAVAERGRRR